MNKACIILIISLLFTTGCFDFDIVHYIEPKKDKSLFIKFRVTSIYFKDQTSKNIFANDIIKANIPDDKNSKVTYQLIQNDLTAGLEITFSAKPQTTYSNSDKLPIIPCYDKYNQYILIFHNYQQSNSNNDLFDSQQIAEGIVSSSKYRLAFGNIIPKKALIIVNRDQPEKFNLSIYQIGNVYFIDIPMNLILINESAVIVSSTNTVNDSEISNYLSKLLAKRKEKENKYQEQLNKNENDDTDEYNNDDNTQSEEQLDNNYNEDENENNQTDSSTDTFEK